MKIGVVTWTLGMTAPAEAICKARELDLNAIQYAGNFRDCNGAELRAATNPLLADAFTSHLAETHGQIERIDQLVESAGLKLKRMKCVAMEGLVEESNIAVIGRRNCDGVKSSLTQARPSSWMTSPP